METLLEGRAIAQNGQHAPVDSVPPRPAARTAAYVLSGAIAALMIAASLAGLLVDGLYHEGAWAREAFRGGDVITLTVAAPLLIISLIMSIRGSHRAEPVWIGMIVYTLYNYAYATFGTAFNDVFLLHIALFSMSVFALACAIPNLDLAVIGRTFRDAIGARTIGVFLVIVGAGQGGLWIFLVVRNAITGEVLHNIPVWGQHLVFALDLALLVPSLVLAGVLLARRRGLRVLAGDGDGGVRSRLPAQPDGGLGLPRSGRRGGRAAIRAGEPVPDGDVRRGVGVVAVAATERHQVTAPPEAEPTSFAYFASAPLA